MPASGLVEARLRAPVRLVLLLPAPALCFSARPLMRAEQLKAVLNRC